MPVEWHKIVGATEVSYLKEVADFYQQISNRHNEQILELESEWKKIQDDEVDEYGRSVKDEYGEMVGDQMYQNEEMQQIIVRSYIMSVCMFVEGKLGELCKHIQKEFSEKISLRDFRGGGRGLLSRIEYIQAITGKTFLDGNGDFPLLIEMRNIIAHENGMVTKDQENALKSKYKRNGLGLNFHNRQIFIDLSILPAYAGLAELCMNEVSNFWTFKEDPI